MDWCDEATVREGLEATYRNYPFIAYGTDWLAFAHLMIALFFILPWRDPVRYEGVLKIGVAMSLLVSPLALICGPIRGIPFGWRLIDCAFGFVPAAAVVRVENPPPRHGVGVRWRTRQSET